MGDLNETNVNERESPLEFGDSEAAKFASVLHDHKEYVDCSLLQAVKLEKVNHRSFNGQERNHVRLGPCFKPEKVEEALESLKDCLPAKFTKPPYLNEPEKLVCHWVRSSNKPTNGWTCSIDTGPWFDRLSSRHDSWRKLRIYEFLRLSTYPRFPFYDALTAGLVCCWNPCLNVFITGQGFRTITLEDIAFITGLSPTGITLPTQSLIDGALDLEKIHPWKNKSNMPFSSIADYYNPSRNKSLPADISRKEEALFINFAFCKMMMFPSCNVNKTFLKLAANIEVSGSNASDVKPLRLGPLFLGQVYRCLYRLRIQEKLYTAGGPVWIISLWGLFYFPFLAKEKANARLDYEELEAEFDKPTVVPVNECCCYGEVAIHSVSPVVHLSFEEVLRGLLSPSELSQSDWHPFSGNDEKGIPLYLHDAKGSLVEDTSGEWMKKAAPVWLLDLSCLNIRVEDQLHWLSLLQPRDLMCIEPKVIGVEAYNPNLVARQFGMTQGLGIPYYKTLNRPWGTRPNILEIAPKSGDNKNTVAEAWLKSVCSCAVSAYKISPWVKWPAVDSGYELWWVDFLKRCQTSWSDAIITLVQHVQGLPRVNRTLSTTPVSAGSNRKFAGAQTTIVSSPSKALSQMESAQASPMTRGQIRKTGKIMGDTSSEKATIEDAEEPDEPILTLFQHVQRLPRTNRSLSTALTPPSPSSTSPRARTTIVAGLSKTLGEMVNSAKKPPVPRGQKRKTEITLGAATSSSKKATTEVAGDSDDDIPLRTLQKRAIRPYHAVPAKSLNNGEVQRDTNIGMNPACQTLEAEAPHTTPDFPENLGTIPSEDAVVMVTLEAEDSLEPPHEMVLGMGSSSLDATCSIPSEDLYDECPDLQAVNPSCSSSLRAEDVASVKGEPMEEEYGAEDPASTDDMSRALIGRSSHPDPSLTLGVPEGVSYTPDKALAEVNSVVALIEDTLRPFPVPSAFDAEKEKAEEIVGILQSNVRELATYANLSEQIHKLLVVSPPQFRPILAHYQTSFLSLRDQLRNIREQEDSMAYQAEALHDLSTVAKELRDRLQISQGRIDQLRTHCSQYDEEINELEAKLLILKQLRESKLQELSTEEQKFAEFSATWSDTIPSLQKVAQTMVSAHQTKAQRECTLKTINDNVQSFVGLLKTM